MEVSAIGSGGLTGGSTTAATSGSAAIGEAGGALSTTTLAGANLNVSMSTGLQSLMEVLGDFTSAEILIAMMLMAAANKDDEEGCGGGAALGLLVGLALAGQIGASGTVELNVSVPATEGGSLGGQIDMTA